MKKTLLAAALTVGLFGVAQAETSVTLYGVIDEGIGYNHTSGTNSFTKDHVSNTKYGLQSGNDYGSRWGLKGVEDLGNGLNVVFQLESGFDENTGESAQGGRLFGRHATVGFQNDSWGRIDFGRMTNVASNYVGVFDPMAASFLNANAGTTFGSANTYRVDNMVMYQTPNISGFNFAIGYSFNANGAVTGGTEHYNQSDANSKLFTTGLKYANGPIAAAVTYDQLRVGDHTSTSGGYSIDPDTGVITGAPATYNDSVNISEWNIGGSYDFEVVKAYLAFGQMRNGILAGSTAVVGDYNNAQNNNLTIAGEGFKANSYLVGLSAPVGAGEIMASWQHSSASRSDDDVKDALHLDSSRNIYGLAYRYPLSKRTVMYAYGSYTQHAAYQDDLKTTQAGIGFRHSF
jgi:predicted porin